MRIRRGAAGLRLFDCVSETGDRRQEAGDGRRGTGDRGVEVAGCLAEEQGGHLRMTRLISRAGEGGFRSAPRLLDFSTHLGLEQVYGLLNLDWRAE